MESAPNYKIILSQATLDIINTYKNALVSNSTKPGAYLNKLLIDGQINLESTSTEAFIELLLWTKKPLIFAESEIDGNGNDWTMKELNILGDLNIAMDVIIYDNGVWSTRDEYFRQYDCPFNGTLLFMPGPLLQGVQSDLHEISDKDNIDQDKYNHLIERRLAPLLYYVNENAEKQQVQAIVTVPGVGCGIFAGRYQGTMGERLNLALQSILAQHAHKFKNVACIYYDPFNECTNQELRFANVKLRVRPSLKNPGKSMLGQPKEYEEPGDNFSNCKLFKVVAWDHVSFPGNDFFGNGRSTDDGVSAAATNSMHMVTGIEGTYRNGKYLPPGGYDDWQHVVHENEVNLKANSHNIHVYNLSDLLKEINSK